MNASNNPFVNWRIEHPNSTLDRDQVTRINQWIGVSNQLLGQFRAFEDEIEPWLKNQAKTSPDLVSFISTYGRSIVVTGNWKELPIAIPDSDLEQWDNETGLPVTIESLRDWQAGLAGAVADMLHLQLDKSVKLIKAQLKKRYAELNDLVEKPIQEFAPTQWDEDMMGEEETGREVERLDRIFDLYEELWCFEEGIEPLRMIMITEDDPEFHLPSKAFHDALLSIDSHELLSKLRAAEPKLREVMRLWSGTVMKMTGEPYHRPYNPEAPKEFWWRHRAQRRTSK